MLAAIIFKEYFVYIRPLTLGQVCLIEILFVHKFIFLSFNTLIEGLLSPISSVCPFEVASQSLICIFKISSVALHLDDVQIQEYRHIENKLVIFCLALT